jgi:hypothetical protein
MGAVRVLKRRRGGWRSSAPPSANLESWSARGVPSQEKKDCSNPNRRAMSDSSVWIAGLPRELVDILTF